MKDNKEKELNTPHDGAFREFFSRRDVATSFLQENLPFSIAQHLDYDTLIISKDTFIDKHLVRSHSDLLYQINYKTHPLMLYLLFEHKSFQDKQTAFQILKYMIRIWELYQKQNETGGTLPAILPLVIYHGKSKWEIDNRFRSLFDIPKELNPYVPDFEYLVHDISHLPDEEIKGSVLLKMILMTFKYIYTPELNHRVKDIFAMYDELSSKTEALEYVEVLARYIAAQSEIITPKVFQDALPKNINQRGDFMATLLQRWTQEAKQEGIQEGVLIGKEEGKKDGIEEMVKNALMNRVPIDTIKGFSHMPVEQILEIQSQLDLDEN